MKNLKDRKRLYIAGVNAGNNIPAVREEYVTIQTHLRFVEKAS